MNPKKIPFAKAKSIFEVDPSFYAAVGVKIVLSDLDNTLDPNKTKTPSEQAKALKAKLDEAGVLLMIISNNSPKRVGRYAEALGVPYACHMLKPFSGRLKKLLKSLGYRPEEALMVGDQIMTDVLASNRAGVRCLLTDPLVKSEPPWTKWNRLWERPSRKKMMKKNMIPSWRSFLPEGK